MSCTCHRTIILRTFGIIATPSDAIQGSMTGSVLLPTSSSVPRSNAWLEGMTDLCSGARAWRLSYLLGVGEIRRRYARSRLGQFWVTLTTALTIGALGFVWSQLWRQPIVELLPFVAISMVFWIFIAGVLGDATATFISAAPILHNQGLAFSTIVHGMILKNIVILAHNLPVIVVALVFGVFHASMLPLVLLGFLLLTGFLFGIGYIIAVVCLRFRDLVQIIQNGVTVLFFITPVLWKPEQIPADSAFLLKINPFAVYLATIQKPLLGTYPTPLEWSTAAGLTVVAIALVIPVAGWSRRRLIYWL